MPRIFIHHADTTIGRMLCAELRSFPVGRNLLYGTQLSAEAYPRGVPKSVRRVIPKSQPKVLLRTLPQCSLVVYCLQNTDITDLSLVLGSLESYDFEKPFTFVLVSSLDTWGRTAPPEPAEGEEPIDTVTDAQFDARVPLPRFEHWRDIENRVKSMHKRCNGNVETFVVNAGVLYGMGEEAFHDLFKDAWLSQAPPPVGGPKSGGNFVPCCHVRDCARLVKTIATNDDRSAGFGDQHCFLAVDRARSTQADIVRAIFAHLSDGDSPPVDSSYEPAPSLSLDLKVKASAPMGDEFEWTHAAGLVEELQAITDQFTKARDLRPVRVVVAGPPLVGKSTQARLIAEHFNLPLISAASVIAEAMAQESQVGQDLRLLLEELEADGTTDPRLPPDRLLALFQWKLGSNVCKSRGYVLDGYPRTVAEAEGLFMVEEESEDGAPPPEEDGEPLPKVPSQRMPAFVVELDCSAETLTRRAGAVAADECVAGHNDKAGLQRRLLEHEERVATSGSCVEFFQDQKIETLHVDIDAEGPASDAKDLFETCRLYMEAKGRPYNYLESAEIVDLRRQAELDEMEKQLSDGTVATQQRRMSVQQEGQQAESEVATERLKLIAQHDAEREEWVKKPLRPFLMEGAIPSLSDALVELCRASPDDPIEFLATYLENEALADVA